MVQRTESSRSKDQLSDQQLGVPEELHDTLVFEVDEQAAALVGHQRIAGANRGSQRLLMLDAVAFAAGVLIELRYLAFDQLARCRRCYRQEQRKCQRGLTQTRQGLGQNATSAAIDPT